MAVARGAFPWKNASSLIIAARNQSGNTSSRFSFAQFTFNYNVMMLKRSAKSSFFAKAYVFPGGAVEIADFSSSWLDVFGYHGLTENKLMEQLSNKKQIKPLIYESLISELLPEIGYRISAIRETFEETGILLCRTSSHDSTSFKLINQVCDWQKKVHEDPTAFLHLCKEKNLYPDILSLFEWSNWLTPAGMGGKRYDTIFYLCALDQTPEDQIDKSEITDIKWLDPVKCIQEHTSENIYLAPPQVYELSRMAHFADCSDLKQFAQKRQGRGIERWLPIRIKDDNGISTILPGDHSYPSQESKNSDVAAVESPNPSEKNKVNRMVFSSPHFCQLCSTVEDEFGHKTPMNLIPLIAKEKDSKL